MANMVMTILEAHVAPAQWPALEQAYQQARGDVPAQMAATVLVQSVAEPPLWRAISVWHSREALDEYRRSAAVPGVQVFRAVGAEPTLSIVDVVSPGGAVGAGEQRGPGTAHAGTTSAAEENKALVRRQFEELWAGHLAVADAIFAADHVDHDPNYPVHDPESWKRLVGMHRAAFPDLHFTVEDMIAAGDKVVTRWTWRGTPQDASAGGPAAGKQITVAGITIDRIADGKIVESWANADNLDLARDLGPAAPPAPPGT